MPAKPPYGLFITGTDTEVGKTWVSSIILKELLSAGHRVGAYKPLASDCVPDGRSIVSEDAVLLWEAAGRPMSLDAVCPQRFQAPMSPHLAARAEGREVNLDLVKSGLEAWGDQCDIVIVEGAGGLMSPVDDDIFFADLALEFGYPVLVVVDNRVGAINQALQASITANCFREGLDVAGIILNDVQAFEGDPSRNSNEEQISQRCMAPVLGRVRHDSESLEKAVDWMAIAKRETASA